MIFTLDYYSHEISFSDMRSADDKMQKEMNTRNLLKEKNQYFETVKVDNKLKTVEKVTESILALTILKWKINITKIVTFPRM